MEHGRARVDASTRTAQPDFGSMYRSDGAATLPGARARESLLKLSLSGLRIAFWRGFCPIIEWMLAQKAPIPVVSLLLVQLISSVPCANHRRMRILRTLAVDGMRGQLTAHGSRGIKLCDSGIGAVHRLQKLANHPSVFTELHIELEAAQLLHFNLALTTACGTYIFESMQGISNRCSNEHDFRHC